MVAITNYLNAHTFPNFQPILMLLVSKFMVDKEFSDKTYISLGLLSPLMNCLDRCSTYGQICHCDLQNRCVHEIISFRMLKTNT